MQQVVYPAMINYDDATNLYYLAMYDVGIFVEGETVEDVFSKASKLLLTFSQVSLEVNGYLPLPTSFEKFKSEHQGTETVLVQTELSTEFVKTYAKDQQNLFMAIDPFGE